MAGGVVVLRDMYSLCRWCLLYNFVCCLRDILFQEGNYGRQWSSQCALSIC